MADCSPSFPELTGSAHRGPLCRGPCSSPTPQHAGRRSRGVGKAGGHDREYFRDPACAWTSLADSTSAGPRRCARSADASRSSRREATRPISAAGCGLRTAGRVVRWLPEPHRVITWSPRSAPGRRLQRAVNQASLPLGGTFWALAPTSRKPPLPGHRLDQSFSCHRGLEPWYAEHVGRTAACARPRSRPSSGAGPARRRQLVGAARCPTRTGSRSRSHAGSARPSSSSSHGPVMRPGPGRAGRAPRAVLAAGDGLRHADEAGATLEAALVSPGPGELARASGYG